MRERSRNRIGFARPAIAVVAVACVIAEFVVLAANIHIRNSQAAVGAGDAARARSQALAAKAIEPWASSPYYQLALVYEAEQRYDLAAQWIRGAISRSPQNVLLWSTAARIEGERGHFANAARDIAEAKRLDPRSYLTNP
jgi:tetratricopeptide (TPR) repeat protein